ncbi:4Fe-4S binding domain-containing protein [Evansella caseinilytica]|uniref:4Fe-4S binding domain-containing protein n=1 Tax=Evansella caseinilytica TaxID=1503961 RepID=A0A1H3QGY6_9BACI|nr:4Fe-4S binding protein [Evansella caseinilytica]SDZ12391.1 4Fe-4S binding domain-containing protein [Evansella caseinilytica]
MAKAETQSKSKHKPSGRKTINLLDIPIIKHFIKSNYYPGIFQWAGIGVFAVIMYQLLFGTSDSDKNFGTAMVWVLWWPVIPILFVAAGRFWCTVCPFGKVSDLVRRFAGKESPMPKFLKKYGIWIIDLSFIAITWSDHVFGIVHSPRGSGYLLLLLLTMVIITSVYYERRTFCKSLCFLGGLAGNYSRAGALELRGTPDICRTCKTQACYRGTDKAEGCNMFQFVKTMQSSEDCNYCGDCVKNCPNDSIRISPRIPTIELWGLHRPRIEHSFLAAVIMGIVFVQNVTMLSIWEETLYYISTITGTTSYPVNFTIAFVIAMIIPIAMLAFASKATAWCDRQTNTYQHFVRFGYALIPLDLAGHLGHNMFHLLTEIKAVWYNFLALFQINHTGDLAVASDGAVQVAQMGMVFIGGFASMYVVYRIGNKQSVKKLWPMYLLMILFGIVNFYLFSVPMEHRLHTH